MNWAFQCEELVENLAKWRINKISRLSCNFKIFITRKINEFFYRGLYSWKWKGPESINPQNRITDDVKLQSVNFAIPVFDSFFPNTAQRSDMQQHYIKAFGIHGNNWGKNSQRTTNPKVISNKDLKAILVQSWTVFESSTKNLPELYPIIIKHYMKVFIIGRI